MTVETFYQEFGCNFETILNRFMRRELVKKFLLRFVDDPTYGALKESLEKKDIPEAFRHAHTLKGIALNLELKPLAEVSSELTELMRGGTCDVEAAEELFSQLSVVYENIIQKIGLLEEA